MEEGTVTMMIERVREEWKTWSSLRGLLNRVLARQGVKATFRVKLDFVHLSRGYIYTRATPAQVVVYTGPRLSTVDLRLVSRTLS